MKLTPLQKRAARKARNGPMVDLNLVSLIDVFTILIFFLLSNSGDVEVLPGVAAVHLPESTAQKTPKPTIVVSVTRTAIAVNGRQVAGASDFGASQAVVAPLKAELDRLSALPANATKRLAEGTARPRAVTILGDKDIPYQLLRQVMATCALANYADVAFAVNRKA